MTNELFAIPQSFTVSELAKRIDGSVRGSGDVIVTGLNAITHAGASQLTLITSVSYARQWASSNAAGAVVTHGLEPVENTTLHPKPRPLIFVSNAELAMIVLLDLFRCPQAVPQMGVHPSSYVDPTAMISSDVRVGPHVSVDARSKIGEGAILHAGVRIYADVEVGAGSVLHANVVIRERCRIGCHVVLHQGVSVGADGFGYRPDPDGAGLLKIQHVGNVIIEDEVEIGANSCIDRAKFGSTIIGKGTKIDNQCQIAHNCRIGRCVLIAGCTGIAGSVTIGDGAMLGGGVCVIEHVNIGSRVEIGGMSFVTRDIAPGERWIGYPADDGKTVLRQWASVRKLPGLLQRLSRTSPRREG